MIDLRSNTCSRPTPEMRAAMANADVGNDLAFACDRADAAPSPCSALRLKALAEVVRRATL
jgi:threonine aldolase